MTTLIQQAITVVPSALALAGGGTAWHFREKARAERRRVDRLRRHADATEQRMRAVEGVLGELASGVIPALQAASVRAGEGHGADLSVPEGIVGSVVADRLRDVAEALAHAVRQVQHDAQLAASAQVAEVREEARAAADDARRASQEATRAAVRSVASSLVATASKVSQQISEGIRRPAGHDDYAAWVGIDQLGHQLLLAGQSYVVLSGGKLTRRWPATSLTDVLRAAMGYVQGYERIRHEESDIAVTSRVVGPVVHTLAALLDNALRYSPTTVDVILREGHHGVTVIIDDSGLQMNPEQLVEARQILAGERPGDVTHLGAHPRTGFPVTAILSREYGFRIEVEAPNARMGTRATVFIPKDLLTKLPPDSPGPDVPAVLRAVPEPPAGTTASGLTVRRTAPARSAQAVQQPARDGQPARPGRSSVATAWAAGTRRARQTPTMHGKDPA
ncbi:ATP-binding protein [Streptomyces sp. BE133]|uniref:ATP-binding protein n=1 Tax=Streptomyces sp. BE133 TaxID=3002523 RepID=UPI002E7A3F59|nr:ATP-binding protein [Streptomyces sp. BE133]MEE1808207.1 ATP-binding protein [Streptomyces sp. BE133]